MNVNYLRTSLLAMPLVFISCTIPIENHPPFSAITGSNISSNALQTALRQLPNTVEESPQFWTRIANDPSKGVEQRRTAILQLFQRHIKRGTKLKNLAGLLDGAEWLRLEDIQLSRTHSGPEPIDTTIYNSLPFAVADIRLLPESKTPEFKKDDGSVIVLRIDGVGSEGVAVDQGIDEGKLFEFLKQTKMVPEIGAMIVSDFGSVEFLPQTIIFNEYGIRK